MFAHQGVRKVKTHIGPAIKAHVIRGASYLLLLLTLAEIPFALAQRNATKQKIAKPWAGSQLEEVYEGSAKIRSLLRAMAAP